MSNSVKFYVLKPKFDSFLTILTSFCPNQITYGLSFTLESKTKIPFKTRMLETCGEYSARLPALYSFENILWEAQN